MKKIVLSLIITISLISCNDFLYNPPTTGLSNDKLVDISSMRALINGAFDKARNFASCSPVYSAAMVRDVLVKNDPNYAQFYDHKISNPYSMFIDGYNTLGLLNTVAVSDLQNMVATDDEKNAVLGDMYFLRALIYFDLNNYFTLPSTGYSVPLVLKPIGVNDRVSCSLAADVMRQVEGDIEKARTYHKNIAGVTDYYAATALAARIYFFHKQYDKAYEMANEVITGNKYILEGNVKIPFTPGSNSKENIFSFKYNATDPTSPAKRMYEVYQASDSKGVYTLNPLGEVAQLMVADKLDARYVAFYKEQSTATYINGKYLTDQMDHIYIRLAEMYLTRSESNIMKNNSVSQKDVDDINGLRNRANPATVLASIPSKEEALNILFNDRTKELAFELGDHYLNVKRLQKGIIKTANEGSGLKPYNEYSELLVYPFPDEEIKIHGLTRKP